GGILRVDATRRRRASPQPARRGRGRAGESDTMSAEHAGDGHGHEPGHGDAHDHIHPAPSHVLTRYVFSTDHKVIGIQFLFSGLIFFAIGGVLAMAIRWQLAWPWSPVPILSRWLW